MWKWWCGLQRFPLEKLGQLSSDGEGLEVHHVPRPALLMSIHQHAKHMGHTSQHLHSPSACQGRHTEPLVKPCAPAGSLLSQGVPPLVWAAVLWPALGPWGLATILQVQFQTPAAH